MEKTREHIAWEKLVRRLEYLNSFGGNRAQMEGMTKLVQNVWVDAGIPEQEEVGENVGFDNEGNYPE